jgi:hypothetical protein
MRQRIVRLFRSRIVLTLMLVLVILSLGGAAYEFKLNYVPGPVSAAQRHNEPIKGYSSHADFEQECLHCHAPVRCLSGNLCQDCHREIARERAESEGLHGLLPGTDKCHTCHVEHEGRDAAICDVSFSAINHELLSGFCLSLHEVGFDGEPLTCESCHPGGQYDAASVACAGCHAAEDPNYMAEHTEQHGDYCAECHDGRDDMTDFEHGEVYTLDGGHEEAGCRDCHRRSIDTEAVRDCADCHEDPTVHAGRFGLRCDWCHTAIAWLPAKLTEHIFRLDHGKEGELACETCHTETYVAYTCYGCHDHEATEIQELHAEQGIDELEPCAECHPTGLEGEAVHGSNAAGDTEDGT